MPDPQAPVAGTHPSGFLPPADTGRAVRTERAGHDGRAIEARLGGGLLAAPKSATEGWSAPNESMAVLQAELEQLRAELQTLRRLGQEARIDHLQAQLANSQNHD